MVLRDISATEFEMSCWVWRTSPLGAAPSEQQPQVALLDEMAELEQGVLAFDCLSLAATLCSFWPFNLFCPFRTANSWEQGVCLTVSVQLLEQRGPVSQLELLGPPGIQIIRAASLALEGRAQAKHQRTRREGGTEGFPFPAAASLGLSRTDKSPLRSP